MRSFIDLSLLFSIPFLLSQDFASAHNHKHAHPNGEVSAIQRNYTDRNISDPTWMPAEKLLSSNASLNKCYAAGHDDRNGYWLADLAARDQGTSPFLVNGQDYRVFRNVKDYGALGDGQTDDTDAFNRAITEQSRRGGGRGRGGYTGQPALIWVPSGTYIISSTVQLFIGTQVIGDPLDLPIIKASPIMRNKTHLISAYDFGQPSTTNFYMGIRNVVLDTRDVAADKTIWCLNWAVSQATSLFNVEMLMPTNSKHIGIEMDGGDSGGGSGLFMSDLSFSGGLIGLHFNNQQYALRSLKFENVETAIAIKHAFTVTMQDIHCSSVSICVDAGINDVPGSISLIDSACDNCAIVVNGTDSILLENLDIRSSGPILQVNGTDQRVGDLTGKTYVLGNSYADDAKVPHSNGSVIAYTDRGRHLVDEDGQYFFKRHPQYTDLPGSAFASVKDAGAKGDGVTDDTQAIQDALLVNVDCRITYFPQGVYLVTDTIYVPPGSRLVGQVLTIITASGEHFGDGDSPQPMIRVGEPGEVGVAEFSDLLFTAADVLPGLILVEVNLAGSQQGDVSFHNVHYRIGGATDSLLQTKCQEESKPCKAAFMVLYLRETSSTYIENSWLWTADHDLDDTYNQQIGTGRGLYIEASKGPTWLVGTGSEHHTFYAYQFRDAQNVFAALMQVESPYWQPTPQAPAPWTPDVATWHDPDFSTCQRNISQCSMQWALRMLGSETQTVNIYGMGVWVFFNGPNYGACSGPKGSCQVNVVEIDAEHGFVMYNLNTKSVLNMITRSNGTVVATQNENNGSWGGVVVAYGNDSIRP
ncbi:Putative pectate lyase superfamily protein [Septoria linicola]|uniref:Pectate lyase superfamily protein n=1 Tax=Septoria linicola TaxID=215465 RepID=A0A9Q9EFP0_9PEZI|nr:Putative pectate lyase superfamily protein [Septoria linicola]